MNFPVFIRTVSLCLFIVLECSRAASSQTAALSVPPSTEPQVVQGLPDLTLSADDLIDVKVYDAPEFGGRYRLDRHGAIKLPMMTERLSLVGLRSEEVADRISDALRRDELLVNPVVSVSVLEYRSRQVTVAGAVKKPGVLQVSGRMTLLDAISLCEGLADNAGPDILVGHAADGKDPAAYQRISAKAVMVAKDPASNLLLTGGEDIRVPEAGKVFVLGNVKKPGVVEVRDAPETSVLRVLAMSEGLAPFSSNTAYIYRAQDGHAEKKEVPVPLKKIIDRKAQDVALLPGDIFYIPDNTGRRNRTEILERTLALGGGVTSALVYAGVH